MMAKPLLRSFLYVPGDRADRVAKALNAGADAILIDLEDAVALSAKELARQVALDRLHSRTGARSQVWVRIKLWRHRSGRRRRPSDRGCASRRGGPGQMWRPGLARGDRFGVPPVSPALATDRVGAQPPSARCLVCPSPRNAMPPGRNRPAGRLGRHNDAGPQLLGHARAEILFASAAARIHPPIGGVYPAFRDLEGLAADSGRLAQLGFAGRPALHPSQVPIINSAFRPTADELATAAALVASYDEALANGRGAVADERGGWSTKRSSAVHDSFWPTALHVEARTK